MKISDEAVEVARQAFREMPSWSGPDMAMRAALNAAVPYLMPDREALAETLFLSRWSFSRSAREVWPGMDAQQRCHWYAMADAVLALLSSEVPSDQPS